MVVLILFLFFLYVVAPENPRDRNFYQPRPCLLAFAFFYFIYFFLSGLQIRFGYKRYKSINSMLTRRRDFNNLILIHYTAIPFLYEIKVMMDWSFCRTSLSLNDWFTLLNIYYASFKAKMKYFSATSAKLGEYLTNWNKISGFCGFILILIIIFGPMILFSGLNPIAQPNLVTAGALQVGIQIQDGNYF